ncbi:MAG TPA: hypothetical protein VIM57_08335 [Luteolibacter sp.]
MKDEFQPLEPVGHETTEARIVAWVHGEVSPTEAAELVRLCAARPDLEAFRKQIAELHSLLGEATTDSGWALSAERRARLEAAFAGAPSRPTPRMIRTTPRWVRPVLLAAAACVALATGFHFIVTPLGDTRLAEGSKSLPSVTALPRESKAPEDFRREVVTAQASQDESPRWAVPETSATFSPLATQGEILADSALEKDAKPFAAQVAQVPADLESRSERTATAGMPEGPVAMAAPLKKKDAAETVTKSASMERQSPLAELNRAMEALPISQRGEWFRGEGSGRSSGSWRFARLQNGTRSEEFEVRISTAKEARDYRLASGSTVKLLVEDGKGVECSRKLVTVDGKTMTIETMLRDALAGK